MKRICLTLLLSLAFFFPLTMNSAKAANNKNQNEANAKRLNLFQAIEEGLVEVQLTPKNAMECSVSVKNNSKKHLLIDMPSTFAGVPVVAQPGGRGMMGGMGGMGGMGAMGGFGGLGEMDAMGIGGRNQDRMGGGLGSRSGSSGNSGGNQSFGGGMGGGRSSGMGGRGGGMFSIAPEKTVREKVRTVCLEHGKKDPTPNVKYTMVPLETYTNSKTTQTLCSMLANEEIDQYALQAAVWNEENGLTFDEMAVKTTRNSGLEHPRPFFQAQQIVLGQQILAQAVKEAQELEKQEQQEDQEQIELIEEEKVLAETIQQEDQTIENLTDQLLNGNNKE
ncbi:MAG: hypothetical protein Q4C95_11040 [Planctomycetia bacterium]|nr:hypothetical protein [Planctomycetia bacterium]